MFKRLKKLYYGTKGIRFLRNEIEELKGEINCLKKQFVGTDRFHDQILNKQITSRYKTIFDLYEQIDNIRKEMFN